MSSPLLRVDHLEVRYGDLIGVADVSLRCRGLGRCAVGLTARQDNDLNAIAASCRYRRARFRSMAKHWSQPAYAIVRKGLLCHPRLAVFTQQRSRTT